MAKTLNELAEKLNISRRTLSRVLKNDSMVAEGTKKRIKGFLEKEEYYPNFHAASLASKTKVKIISLIFPKGAFLNADYYVIEILRGVSLAAEENGYEVMLYSQESFEASACIRLYKSKLVGGIVLTGIARNNFEVLRKMKKEKVPFVVINSHYRQTDSFACDNKLGGYLAVKHLINSGRRRIAFIHGHKDWIDAIDRFEGYKKALEEAKIPFNKDYLEFGYFGFKQGKLAAAALLNLKPRPDAIFAANDQMAMGAIKAIRERKLKVPRDVAVVGFDDNPACEHFTPPITTISQPLREVAYLGAKRLIEVMSTDKQLSPHLKLIKPAFILRMSA